MYRRPLRLQTGTIPSPAPETAPEMTMDQHGLPPAGWDRLAKASLQGGRRAAFRNAVERVQFKSAGPSGTISLKRK
jgi:hypothetical protein